MINTYSENALSNPNNKTIVKPSFITQHPFIFSLIVVGSVAVIGGVITGIYLSTLQKKENTEITDQPTEEIIEKSIFPLPETEEFKIMEIYNSIGDKDKGTLNEFCDFLAEKASNLKDEEKVYLAYYWIIYNIIYDTDGFTSGTAIVDPDIFFSSKTTICSGYSQLFKRLLLAMNFPENNIEIIFGFAKGVGYSGFISINDIPTHDWNAVKLNNNWCLIDTTWGAGGDFYFLCTPPKCLIRSHLPDERQKEFQLIENKIDKQTFHKILNGDKGFCDYDVEIIEDKTVQNICGKGKISIKYKNEYKLSLKLITGVSYEEISVFPLNKQNEFDIFFSVNKNGQYNIGVFFTDPEKKKTFPITYLYITCDQEPIEKFYYPVTLYYYEFEEIELIYPLTRFLEKGQKYDFKIKIVGYEHLHITMAGEKISMKKIGKDTFEEKDVFIHDDEVYITYRNATDSKNFLLFPTTGEALINYPVSNLFYTNLNLRLFSPIQGNLIKGETYEFKIRCDDNTNKFMVYYGTTDIDLEENNGYFTKTVTIDSGTSATSLKILYYDEDRRSYYSMYEYNLN